MRLVKCYFFLYIFFDVLELIFGTIEACQLSVSERHEFTTDNSLYYKIDTALLTVHGRKDYQDLSFSYFYFWRHGECFDCAWFSSNISNYENHTCFHRLQTKYFNDLKFCTCLNDFSNCSCCTERIRLLDKGEYTLANKDFGKCAISLNNHPPPSNLPMLILISILIGTFIFWNVLKYLMRKHYFDDCSFYKKFVNENKPSTSDDDGNECDTIHEPTDIIDDVSSKASSQIDLIDQIESSDNKVIGPIIKKEDITIKKKLRVKSLDSFRGLSLALMIFVNSGSGGYYYFQHAIWNGFTIGDLVFPWFIFIMGASMSFSMKNMRKNEGQILWIVYRIINRAIKLFLLGIFINTSTGKSYNDMRNVRIPGVLQRISFTYLVVALIHLVFVNKYLKINPNENVKWCAKYFADLYPFILEWILMLLILTSHLLLTFLLDVPGCPTGYIGAGGLADNANFYNCTGGSAKYIDQIIFGNNHLIKGWGTYMEAYSTNRMSPLDPEGILGTFTSIFLCFLGLQAGKILLCYKSTKDILSRYCFWMCLTFLIGLLLCEARQNGGWIPFNKNLWSVSYIFMMASTGYACLIILYFSIDVIQIWDGSPIIYLGLNSIVIYVCSAIFKYNFPVSWQMPDEEQHWQILIVDFWTVVFWNIVSYIMYLKDTFIAL